MILVVLVCLFFFFVCGQHYVKNMNELGLNFMGGVLGSTMKN